MTLTDIIIVGIVTLILSFIIYFRIIKSNGCQCSQMRHLSKLKKYYQHTKCSK
ncbi:MAG: hypothetical protein WCQ80_01940 [Bacilli bacterium]